MFVAVSEWWLPERGKFNYFVEQDLPTPLKEWFILGKEERDKSGWKNISVKNIIFMKTWNKLRNKESPNVLCLVSFQYNPMLKVAP